jgi:hypothetical protein
LADGDSTCFKTVVIPGYLTCPDGLKKGTYEKTKKIFAKAIKSVTFAALVLKKENKRYQFGV